MLMMIRKMMVWSRVCKDLVIAAFEQVGPTQQDYRPGALQLFKEDDGEPLRQQHHHRHCYHHRYYCQEILPKKEDGGDLFIISIKDIDP